MDVKDLTNEELLACREELLRRQLATREKLAAYLGSRMWLTIRRASAICAAAASSFFLAAIIFFAMRSGLSIGTLSWDGIFETFLFLAATLIFPGCIFIFGVSAAEEKKHKRRFRDEFPELGKLL